MKKIYLEEYPNTFSKEEADPHLLSIKNFFGLEKEPHLYLTPSHQENLFQILFGHYMGFIRETGRNYIFSTVIESVAFSESAQYLSPLGLVNKLLPVNSAGQLTKEIFLENLKARVSLLSISLAHPLTGVIQPMEGLAEICAEHEIKIHIDVTSALGKIDLKNLSFSPNFFSFGVKEKTGFISFNSEFKPPIQKKYSFTDLKEINGALQYLETKFDHFCLETARLRNQFEIEIEKNIQGSFVFFKESPRLPNISVVAFAGINGESLLFHLAHEQIFASLNNLSQVLQNLGVEKPLSHGAVRFDFSHEITEEDVERVLEIIMKNVKKLRTYSMDL
ncbi:MAG: aminotransferase class V-fold PLP-dependent enzyme [Chlamydiae bacterium]|nr:aminotransferase class V-fold PLP-dependent enzyme [Chlamydiota bacterium]